MTESLSRTDVICRVDSGAFCETCVWCKLRLSRNQWCQECEKKTFQSAFKTWTSGSNDLDKFIRKTQLKATSSVNYLEWIPYDRLTDVRFIASGAYGIVSSATWSDGPRWNWNDNSKMWERTGPKQVALKTINNSKHISISFFNELKLFYNSSIDDNRIIRCYGISRDPQTKNYIMVIEYAGHGSLVNYLSKNFSTLTWNNKLNILSDIVQGLKNIHELNLVHRDLHAGNILVHTGNKDYAAISDLGLCHFAGKGFKFSNTNAVYGVIPYVAPEVLQGRPYTRASDIYSTGVLMWIISSGKQPFADRDHDFQLQVDICNGIRPEITQDTPQFYQDLMESCWNQDPKLRPTIQAIQINLRDFIKGTRDVQQQIEEAEKTRLELQTNQIIITSPPATYQFYTSREIKVIHVSPTKLNLEVYNLKPKWNKSKKLKFGVKKPEQALTLSKEKIHFQFDLSNTDNPQMSFDPFNTSQTAIITLPDALTTTSLNLELTDYTKKTKKTKLFKTHEKKPEKLASEPDARFCRCVVM